MHVALDTSPLRTAHSSRGIGAYTRGLLTALRQDMDPHLIIHATHEMNPDQPTPHGVEYDVIHYPFFDFFFSTLPPRQHTPVVVTIHDVIPLVFPDKHQPGFRGALRWRGQLRRVQNVDAIITDSLHSQRDIHEYLNIAFDRIHVVPLAAATTLQPLSEYLAHKYTEHLKLPEKFVVYVGDINYNKNLPTLLLALTQLPEDVHLCVVSRTFRNTDIPEGKAIATTIEQNHLQSRIQVLDIPAGEDTILSAVIARARCLVQPSLYEGFGLPVLEAMQVGTVVVASDAASLPEVGGEAAILVEPTIAGLAAGMQEALSLRGEERERRIRMGQQRAAQFTWEQTAQATKDVYTKVLES